MDCGIIHRGGGVLYWEGGGVILGGGCYMFMVIA